MSTIHLKDIRLFANHGCLTEEEKIGSDYLVNVKVKANLVTAAESDQLSDTVDYVHLNRIVKSQMAIRSKLLEHVGKRIIDAVFEEIPLVSEVKVKVAKINPPIGGDVDEVSVTMKSKR
ncbi:MAG: dihydroneopterin aldolase [Flavobacteriaceae bacterium]